MAWRRRINRDVWHFCENCSNWPRRAYQITTKKPTSGELCNQCLSKSRRNVCK